VVRPVWNPFSLQIDQGTSALHHLVNAERWEAQLLVARVHSLKVLVHSVEDHIFRILLALIGLAALEAFDTVVKGGVSWV